MKACPHHILAVALVGLLGCTDAYGPLAIGPQNEPLSPDVQAELECIASTQALTLQCAAPLSRSAHTGLSPALIGGQGVYLSLESANVAHDLTSEIFSAQVSVRSLLTQTLGAVLSGGNPEVDPDGIRVFFLSNPETVDGSGTIGIVNASGVRTFTASAQPYYQYDQALSPGQRSLPVEWNLQVPATVESFSFRVAISARLLDEDQVDPGLTIAASTIAAGRSHTCALAVGGALFCWGTGPNVEPGTDSAAVQLTPVPVAEPAGGAVEFASVSNGSSHSCALTNTGSAYCWGAGSAGQLGVGADLSGSDLPVAVPGIDPLISLSAGSFHNCGLTTSGAAYCWGLGDRGRLGNGDSDSVAVGTPQAVIGGHSFQSISVGTRHTCALDLEGRAYCWGAGAEGQLGDNGTTASAVPVPVADPETGPVAYTEISAGGVHTCALSSGGQVYCWGNNSAGQAGNSDQATNPVPRLVPDPVGGATPFVAISAGGIHTCALSAMGKAYCWGLNLSGQLGNGDLTGGPQGIPVPVIGDHRFVSIGAGELYTCATTGNGQGYCWGAGGQGQLGNGSNEEEGEFEPVPISAITSHLVYLSPLGPVYAEATNLHTRYRSPLQASLEEMVALPGSAASPWRG